MSVDNLIQNRLRANLSKKNIHRLFLPSHNLTSYSITAPSGVEGSKKVDYTLTLRPLIMRTLHYFRTCESVCYATESHIPEEQNAHA
jgi:hypothetical protein